MHILTLNSLSVLDCLRNFISRSSILKEKLKNNHLTVSEETYFQHLKKHKDELLKPFGISQMDILSRFQYKPSMRFVNEEGKEIKKIGHKIFVIENITSFNVVQIGAFVKENQGIIFTYDPKIKKALEEAKEIKTTAINYEERKKEAEKKYELALKRYEQDRALYEQNLSQYYKEKKEIEEYNKQEKKLAKEENRKPVLKEFNVKKPKAPEKPKKERVNVPKILDSLYLKQYLSEILLTYLYDIKKITEDLYLLQPVREIEGTIFKREYLSQLSISPTIIDFLEVIEILEQKIFEEELEHNKKLKESKKFFYSSFTYGGDNKQSYFSATKYINAAAVSAFAEIQDEPEKWEILENFSKTTSERELPILTKLKPNQTASMLAGGIGSFAKEIDINDEKMLIKGATVKRKNRRQTNVNNMIVEEIIETYSQEIGVLNLSRRELQIIK